MSPDNPFDELFTLVDVAILLNCPANYTDIIERIKSLQTAAGQSGRLRSVYTAARKVVDLLPVDLHKVGAYRAAIDELKVEVRMTEDAERAGT